MKKPSEPNIPKCIPHPRLRCPRCAVQGSDDEGYRVSIDSTRHPERFCTCDDCGYKFRTYDYGPHTRSRYDNGDEVTII